MTAFSPIRRLFSGVLLSVLTCKLLDFISRQSVCTAKVKVGAPEKQRAHHRLLHKADPGGAEIPARQPDSTPRYQGDYGEVTVQFCLFDLLFVLHFFGFL